jgi:hypothetical protein
VLVEEDNVGMGIGNSSAVHIVRQEGAATSTALPCNTIQSLNRLVNVALRERSTKWIQSNGALIIGDSLSGDEESGGLVDARGNIGKG